VEELPLHTSSADRVVVLLNGVLNFRTDIDGLLQSIKSRLSRHCRIIAVAYNPYLRFLYRLANVLRLRTGKLPDTFLTRTDLNNLARISGFEVVRLRPIATPVFVIPGSAGSRTLC